MDDSLLCPHMMDTAGKHCFTCSIALYCSLYQRFLWALYFQSIFGENATSKEFTHTRACARMVSRHCHALRYPVCKHNHVFEMLNITTAGVFRIGKGCSFITISWAFWRSKVAQLISSLKFKDNLQSLISMCAQLYVKERHEREIEVFFAQDANRHVIGTLSADTVTCSIALFDDGELGEPLKEADVPAKVANLMRSAAKLCAPTTPKKARCHMSSQLGHTLGSLKHGWLI